VGIIQNMGMTEQIVVNAGSRERNAGQIKFNITFQWQLNLQFDIALKVTPYVDPVYLQNFL